MSIPSLPRAQRIFVFSLIAALSACVAAAQQVSPQDYQGLRWRMIGPHRGGRSISVSGIEGRPGVYYFGAVGGGVWKTVNAGETWKPVFDGQPIASIGALAVAPSNPDILYVGTGEADFRSDLTYGDGVYKSTDAGKTWSHLGLRDSRHIARIIVDPHNPNVLLVAALGEAYGPSPERGVYRSTDGGANFQRVLFKDNDTGAIDMAADPDNFQTIYAALVHDQRPPWSTYAPTTTGGTIYKSTDAGKTWKPITGGGLPTGDLGRIGLAVARGTGGKRVYAIIDAQQEKERGLYRSDDSGQTWTRVGLDPRIAGRGWYFMEVIVDPKNPDVVYAPNVSLYRSTDAGKTFTAIKGAPGGDDYHSLWIDPQNPQRMIFGSDQGVGISVDGGNSWSSWYNQATGQFYHVSVDNAFPYHIYGAQQDSGSVDITSRGNDGSITFRDWHSAGAGESGYIAADPKDPNILYGGGTFGELNRYNKRTGQVTVIAPEAVRTFGAAHPEMRFTWTSPLVFSPQNPHVLYLGAQYVLKSSNRGDSWEKISPDLTGMDLHTSGEGPLSTRNAKARGHGVVYTIAPSPVAAGQIWTGSDTGLIHLTRDGGKTWKNVTPPELSDWSKISLIEASHFDARTAYAAVDRHRLSDIAPYIYRTRDFGKTWKRINSGIPNGAFVRAVREDPVRKSLLFAGTELGVFFSLNAGDSWQPLNLNLPVVPIRDLVIKDNDLIAATHGRSFWVLDDISPLRQLTPAIIGQPAHLYVPAKAVRIRPSTNHDTPLPREIPAGQNPPPGAILYYHLKSAAQGAVKLEVLDSSGKLVRAYSSHDQPWSPTTPPPFPDYWFAPEVQLSAAAGTHRFIWDLRYAPPVFQSGRYTMATVVGMNVAHQPQGPYVLPGDYQVRLTVDGKSYTQPLTLVMDPRVLLPKTDLEGEFALQMKLYHALLKANSAADEIARYRKTAASADQEKMKALDAIEPAGRRNGGPPPEKPTLSSVRGALGQIAVQLDATDAAPTSQQAAAAEKAIGQLNSLLKAWEAFKK